MTQPRRLASNGLAAAMGSFQRVGSWPLVFNNLMASLLEEQGSRAGANPQETNSRSPSEHRRRSADDRHPPWVRLRKGLVIIKPLLASVVDF